MAKFLKHIGKHGDRKVAIIFREIPGEEHMCLVVYTELLNQNMHDPLMTCIESPQGQAALNLGEALNREYTRDGQIILQVLHREGMMKKIQTEQVMMTPAPNQRVKLSELNGILAEMSKGEEAIRRLAEIDASRGLQDPKDVAKRKRGENTVTLQQDPPPVTGILGNNELARNLRTQAARMEAEAKGLLAESARLQKEAAQMEGVKVEAPAPKKSRQAKVKVVEPIPTTTIKKVGRTKKATTVG